LTEKGKSPSPRGQTCPPPSQKKGGAGPDLVFGLEPLQEIESMGSKSITLRLWKS
jgi:hypothetical protein